jgi:serine protease AprX
VQGARRFVAALATAVSAGLVAGTLAAPSGAQAFSLWSLGTGTVTNPTETIGGTGLDGLTPLSGNRDVWGPFTPSTWAAASSAGTSWNGGSWLGRKIAGDGWTGTSWAARTWAPATWAGTSWSGQAWTADAWTGRYWSGRYWSAGTWSGRYWSSSLWASSTWTL